MTKLIINFITKTILNNIIISISSVKNNKYITNKVETKIFVQIDNNKIYLQLFNISNS